MEQGEGMRPDTSTLTSDDLMRAYVKSGLRRIGVSYQKAVMQQSTYLALRITALIMSRKDQQSGNLGKPC